MEQWKDKAIKKNIEDLIEESYLFSLTEREIKDYLRNFVKSCETVLRENISVHGDTRATRIKIALIRAYLLMNESNFPRSVGDSFRNDSTKRIEFLAQQVIQIKRTIIILFDDISPKLSRTVIKETRKRNEDSLRQLQRYTVFRNLMIEAGFYLLLFIAVSLLLVMVFY